jgi:hypothetical protein
VCVSVFVCFFGSAFVCVFDFVFVFVSLFVFVFFALMIFSCSSRMFCVLMCDVLALIVSLIFAVSFRRYDDPRLPLFLCLCVCLSLLFQCFWGFRSLVLVLTLCNGMCVISSD